MDLYDAAAAIGSHDEIRHIEVDCREDEDTLRRCLGKRVRMVNPANQAFAE